MLNTLAHGYGGGEAKKAERAEYILDKHEWQVAMAELTEYAMTLNSHGFDVNTDRVDEPLDHLQIMPAGDPTGEGAAVPVMGFLESDPATYCINKPETGNRQKMLKRAMAQNLEKELEDLVA
ncbi:hypothetical protein CDV55_105153 [Aspergillus turcosus]|uniref:Uncharacterized protein n=1 Tax=Aspergillus turcosus TaxID=1245748 RepID=A0A229XNE9_9EURO|nr:hypothetical protein CDV55_105153 [Aspergillus turcosus]RLL99700.1 hypothetical protein CFD26_103842 [Aspergillus turcosus]